MARVNVYLSDDLDRRVRAAGIPISEVCQRALAAAAEEVEGGGDLLGEDLAATFRTGWSAGGGWVRTAPREVLLTVLRDQRLADLPDSERPADQFAQTRQQVLAWEAGFVEAVRASVRSAALASAARSDGPPTADSGPTGSDDPELTPEGVEPDEASSAADDAGLGDDSDCTIGVSDAGTAVSFDPHTAVRSERSPVYAVVGAEEARIDMTLSVAQDAAARGAGVVLVDASGRLAPRARGLGKTVRVVDQSQAAFPQLDDLLSGAVGLGGLWETISRVAAGTQRAAGSVDSLLEPGYVTVLNIAGGGGLPAVVSLAHTVQAALRSDGVPSAPRLLHVDLPDNLTAQLSGQLNRVNRLAHDHDVAIGLSAEHVETITRVASGATLSTVFAFPTSDLHEADRLRDVLGAQAPILITPPGAAVPPADDRWVLMRDVHGRLGQVRLQAG
jgi:hypothetical protein